MTKEDIALEKRRIKLQCRRGMLELDIFLNRFLDKAFDGATQNVQEAFVELLKSNDQDLFVWLTGREDPIDPTLKKIVSLVRDVK